MWPFRKARHCVCCGNALRQGEGPKCAAWLIAEAARVAVQAEAEQVEAQARAERDAEMQRTAAACWKRQAEQGARAASGDRVERLGKQASPADR